MQGKLVPSICLPGAHTLFPIRKGADPCMSYFGQRCQQKSTIRCQDRTHFPPACLRTACVCGTLLPS